MNIKRAPQDQSSPQGLEIDKKYPYILILFFCEELRRERGEGGSVVNELYYHLWIELKGSNNAKTYFNETNFKVPVKYLLSMTS